MPLPLGEKETRQTCARRGGAVRIAGNRGDTPLLPNGEKAAAAG